MQHRDRAGRAKRRALRCCCSRLPPPTAHAVPRPSPQAAATLEDASLQEVLTGYLAKAEQHRLDMDDKQATVEHLVRCAHGPHGAAHAHARLGALLPAASRLLLHRAAATYTECLLPKPGEQEGQWLVSR